MAKVWKEEEIKGMLLTRTDAVQKALVRLLSFQTYDEQAAGKTAHKNGMGFNGVDAMILTSFASQVQQGRNLSVKQLELARKKLVKYAGQLTRFANGSYS